MARIKESYFKIAKKKQLAVAIKILKLLKKVHKESEEKKALKKQKAAEQKERDEKLREERINNSKPIEFNNGNFLVCLWLQIVHNLNSVPSTVPVEGVSTSQLSR